MIEPSSKWTISVQQYKTTIVDRVVGMEPTFAHLIPEMTANVLVPIVIVVYLLILDWRMALLSLVTLVVGLWLCPPV